MEYIETRLQQWAEWYVRGNNIGLGYPSRSIEHRLMIEGVVIASTAPRDVPYHADAEEIEALVCELAAYNEDLAAVLRIHYLMIGSIRQKSKVISLSREKFSHYIDLARMWLSGRLN